MPELPEVETVVRTLRPLVRGRRIVSLDLRREDIVDPRGVDLRHHLSGRTITSLRRRAKRIVFTLDDQNRFYIHLGMTGSLTAETHGAPCCKHTHLVIRLQDGGEIHFCDPRRFGGIWWIGRGSVDDELGPEPLDLPAGALAKRLQRTHRAIKSALLDQRLIAGLGNIYVDESLFVAGIHPLARADRLSHVQVVRLSRAIKQILGRAIRHRGSTLRNYRDGNGRAGNFQKLHAVYHQTHRPCIRCRTAIKRIIAGGRSTHFCPRCQSRR